MTDAPERSTSYIERRTEEIVDGGQHTIPLEYEDLEAEARKVLDGPTFDYVDASAGEGTTKAANREGFRRWRIVPRPFRDVSERSLQANLLGETLDAPVMLSPVGRQKRFHDRGEAAAASAANSLGVPVALSTWSTCSLEAIADRTEDVPAFFQLYWVENREVVASLVRRAEKAGYRGIVLTVDSKVPTWRTQNLANEYEVAASTTPENFTTDPVVQRLYGDADVPLAEAITDAPELAYDVSISWDDLEFLREQTSLPIFLKGIVHPVDAERAVECGVDGVVVSTHGGRQIDGSIGAVEALPAVVDAIDGHIPVLLDSGVRTAADTFKALALGADAVFLGRPFVYALALAGEQGIYELLANHLAELESILGLTGHTDVNDLGEVDLREMPR